jgi:hypothetical protein
LSPKEKKPWDGMRGGLKDATRNLHLAEKRAPTDADRPPPSLLPMTPAAREAVRLRKDGEQPKR